jgi:hypothetical protein
VVQASKFVLERDQPKFVEEVPAEGIVHVTGPGIPPGTAAVSGRVTRTLLFQASLHQSHEPGAWPFTLPPQNSAQIAP